MKKQMEYHRNCGLSKREWDLERIVNKIKNEQNTLICIKILDEVSHREQLIDFVTWQTYSSHLGLTIEDRVDIYLKNNLK